MKIELENLKLGHSPLTDEIFTGITNKKGDIWLHKKNVTNDFIGCVLSRWGGYKETVTCQSNGKQYKISVEEIKQKKSKNNS